MNEWSAVILAGGFGKRLMPLTSKICKPMVSVANKPMIDYAIDHLRYADINKIMICVKYQGDLLSKSLLDRWNPVMEENSELKIKISNKDSNGTADAVRQVWDQIETENFIVSMADIITNLPMKNFKDYHLSKSADATISMKMIDEFATRYGNTILDDNGKIQLFLEKPSAQEIYLSSLAGTRSQEILPIINTGLYCFKKETAQECIMETSFMDFGKEIFPFLLENKYNLYGFIPKSNYYWMDIGNPKTYLWANWDILREYGWPLKPEGDDNSKNKIYTKDKINLPQSSKIKSRVCLGRKIQFGENVSINSLSVIGNNVKIGNGTIINKSVIWDNVEIGEKCIIDESVIADGCKIADNVTVRSESILGPDVYVNEGLLLDSSTISYKKEVS